MYTIQHFINGETFKDNQQYADVYNPALGSTIGKVSIASESTTKKAINAAKDAFPGWRATPPLKRAQIFFKFKQLLEQNRQQISLL